MDLPREHQYDAKTKLKEFKLLLDAELKRYFDQKTVEAREISPITEELVKQIANLTLRGGKRIRPALLYYSYIGHGGRNKDEALKASMALELSETYMLIHDDIMDNDSLRRGGQTIQSHYEGKAPQRIEPREFGRSMALVAGDMACAMSSEILLARKFKPHFIQKATLLLNEVYQKEGYGQILDYVSADRENFSKDDLLLIHRLKTVPYTFDGPMKIGAVLAGATDKQLKKIEGYSVPLGTAFQIQDDILGLFGTEEKLGKPVASDLREGKRTLLVLDALANATLDRRNELIKNLGAQFDLELVRDIVSESGALEKSKKICGDMVLEASEIMNKLRIRALSKQFFLGIAEYMIKRDY